MKDIMMPCPYCDSNVTVKFPCCGYLCMRCGRTFTEEDKIELGNNAKTNEQIKS